LTDLNSTTALKKKEGTYVHDAAWTNRLALLDARGAGALDGGAVAGL